MYWDDKHEYCYSIYRRCITGADEYRYYHKDELVGNATALTAYHYPVIINGDERTLYCEHDPELTLFPGCRKTIFSGNQEYAAVVYLGRGQHCLKIGTNIIWIINDKNIIYFYRNNVLVATLCSTLGRSSASGDWEQQQILYVLDEMCADYLLLLLSFSLLRIGI